jgi:hypothetical protein
VIVARPEAVVPAEQVRLLRMLVLDDDGHVLERSGDLGREVVDRRLDMLFERHQYAGCKGCRLRKR